MLYSIVTADSNELRSGDLALFLESIAGHDITVILVLRDVSKTLAMECIRETDRIHVLYAGKAGISEVRNIGLKFLDKMGISPTDFISFPDDDCKYPINFRDQFDFVVNSTNADLVVGSYGELPALDSRPSSVRLSRRTAILSASSITIFATWEIVRSVGGFNEGLGVGSGNFLYGEDNDFCYRLLKSSKMAVYSPGIRIWHLENRETVGRNSKGYLTGCLISPDVYRVFTLLLPGLCTGLVRDLFAFDFQFRRLQLIKKALDPEMISRGRRQRYSASNLFRTL